MRRFQLIFAIVVVTSFLSAFLVERSRPARRPMDRFDPTLPVQLEPLEATRGDRSLRGRVVRANGKPAEGVTVRLRAVEAPAADGAPEAVDEPIFFDHTDSDGRFELRHLPTGTFDLLLLAVGHPHTNQTIEVPAAGEVLLRLPEPWGDLRAAPELVRTSLEGLLAAPAGLGGPPLAEYEVLLLPRGDEAPWRGGVERRQLTDASGRFRFEELAVADYTLHVLPPWARGGSWPYLAEVELARGDLGGATGSEERDPTRVELATAELGGTLRNGEGRAVEGALVRLHPQGRAGDLWPAAISDEKGRFAFRDLPPEVVYVVEVIAGGERQIQHALAGAGRRGEVRFGALEPEPLPDETPDDDR
ncbi:MAG: carboxypeptidase-like regulatory domain-containing protein [Planctomycetota bacterium]